MPDQPTTDGRRLRRTLWIVAALLCFAAFAQHFAGIGFTKKIAIEPEAIGPDKGHSWRVRLPEEHRSSAALYKIRILEDGEHNGTLARSNRLVRDHGTGRYRLGKNGILRFSASDNSNPEFNGKKYVAEVPVSVSPVLLIAGLAVFAGAGFLARRRQPFAPRRAPPVSLIALAVLAVALVIRIWALEAYADYSDGAFAVKGSPYSDALAWTDLALNLKDGHGFEGTFAGQRPLYQILTASVYRFFGDSLTTGKMVNVCCGALSVTFVFLLVSHASRHWSIGLAAAVTLLWTREQLTHVQLLVTEPMGLTLILVGAYAWWAGLVGRNPWTLFAAGLIIGISNLTHTFTLLGLPAFALIILAVSLFEKTGWRRALLLCATFTVGATMAIAPWMIRQKLRYDTFALSSFSADLLYAASKDEPGWNNSLYEELNAAGIQQSQLKERSRYFSRRHKEEVFKDPGRYARRVIDWLGDYWNYYDFKDPILRLVLLLAGLAGSFIAWWHGRPLAGAVSFTVTCGLISLLGLFPPAATILAAAAIALWLGHRSLRLAVIVMLATLTSGSILCAMIGTFAMNRTAALTAWIFPALVLLALTAIFRRFVLKEEPEAPASEFDTEARSIWWPIPFTVSWTIIGLAAAAVIVVASTGFSNQGRRTELQLTEAEQAAVRDWIHTQIPATETAPDSVLLASLVKLTPYRSALRANEDTSHSARSFLPRPYDRTAAFVRLIRGSHPRGTLRASQFAGPPESLDDIDNTALYILSGILNIDENGHDIEMVEAIVLIPFSENERIMHFEKAIRFPVTPEAAAILNAKSTLRARN
jgi:hypothetical protein